MPSGTRAGLPDVFCDVSASKELLLQFMTARIPLSSCKVPQHSAVKDVPSLKVRLPLLSLSLPSYEVREGRLRRAQKAWFWASGAEIEGNP